LQALYPDYKPVLKGQRYWGDIKNRKAFFDQLAVKWNIQKMEDWLKVTQKMLHEEGAYFINYYSRGSLIRGTIHYTFIELIIEKLWSLFILHWNGTHSSTKLPHVILNRRPFCFK
jgi:hypothetical protein